MNSPDKSAVAILSPWEVRALESVWLTSTHPTPLARLCIGSALTDVFRSEKEAAEVLALFAEQSYILNYTIASHTNECTVHLLYKENCTREGMLRGLVHSYVVRSYIIMRPSSRDEKGDSMNNNDDDDEKLKLLRESMQRSHALTAEQFHTQGWALDEMLFEPTRSRVSVSLPG
jgi:hypothetical protein